jgi:hypothetical protein
MRDQAGEAGRGGAEQAEAAKRYPQRITD